MSASLELGTSQEDLATNGNREEDNPEETEASSNVAVESDSDNEQHDLSSILAYLIRRYYIFSSLCVIYNACGFRFKIFITGSTLNLFPRGTFSVIDGHFL